MSGSGLLRNMKEFSTQVGSPDGIKTVYYSLNQVFKEDLAARELAATRVDLRTLGVVLKASDPVRLIVASVVWQNVRQEEKQDGRGKLISKADQLIGYISRKDAGHAATSDPTISINNVIDFLFDSLDMNLAKKKGGMTISQGIYVVECDLSNEKGPAQVVDLATEPKERDTFVGPEIIVAVLNLAPNTGAAVEFTVNTSFIPDIPTPAAPAAPLPDGSTGTATSRSWFSHSMKPKKAAAPAKASKEKKESGEKKKKKSKSKASKEFVAAAAGKKKSDTTGKGGSKKPKGSGGGSSKGGSTGGGAKKGSKGGSGGGGKSGNKAAAGKGSKSSGQKSKTKKQQQAKPSVIDLATLVKRTGDPTFNGQVQRPFLFVSSTKGLHGNAASKSKMPAKGKKKH